MNDSAGLDMNTSVPELGLPSFEMIKIGKQVHKGINLNALLNENRCEYSTLIKIPASTHKQIEIICQINEVLKVGHSFNWITHEIADGLTVEIDTTGVPELEFEMSCLHPSNKELIQETVGTKWKWILQKGILPFQGCELRTRYRDVNIEEDSNAFFTKPVR